MLTDIINLSAPTTNDLKYRVNQVFNLLTPHNDPLDTIPLSELEVESIFLTNRNSYITIITKRRKL